MALRQGFAYVWSTPVVRAVMLLAFLVNFAAYPWWARCWLTSPRMSTAWTRPDWAG